MADQLVTELATNSGKKLRELKVRHFIATPQYGITKSVLILDSQTIIRPNGATANISQTSKAAQTIEYHTSLSKLDMRTAVLGAVSRLTIRLCSQNEGGTKCMVA